MKQIALLAIMTLFLTNFVYADERTNCASIDVPWILWSTIYPGNQYYSNEIHASKVKEYKDEETCQKALSAYRVQVDKAYPQPECEDPNGCTRWVTWATVDLECSPINPKP